MPFKQTRTIRLEKGLWLVEQAGRATYAARGYHEGKLHYTSCETAEYRAAEQSALRWFRNLRAAKHGGETMDAAATAYLDSIVDPNKRANHTERWEAVREFFRPGYGRGDRLVADVDSPVLMDLIGWKRTQNPQITASTIKKDLVTVRQVLKHAVMRGMIPNVPTFPGAHQIGSVKANPQPWLTKDEWQHLLAVASERINDAPNARTRAQRQELRDFCEFMWLTALRVDEARELQVRDITVKHTKAIPVGYVPVDTSTPNISISRGVGPQRDVRIEYHRVDKHSAQKRVRLPYLEIRLRKSKTGPRTCQSRAFYADALFRRLTKGKKPTDLLFAESHRDAFRELLIAADLRTNHYGNPRNSKCLRPTAISHWLLDKPTIPLSWLAANCGTSITMLQEFYVKRLGLALDGSAWL